MGWSVAIGIASIVHLSAFAQATAADMTQWDLIGDTVSDHPMAGHDGPYQYVVAEDRAAGETWYFAAPGDLIHTLRAAEGQRLSFLLYHEGDGELFDDHDVVIDSAAGTLNYDMPDPPVGQWSAVSIPLLPCSTWTLDGEAVDPQSFAAAIQSATALFIRGEFIDGPDAGRLANVVVGGLADDCPANGPPAQTAASPVEYVQSGAWYQVIGPRTDWMSAARDCVARGGHLAEIENKAESEFVTSLVSQCGGAGCWIGASDRASEEQFRWNSGRLMDFTNWGPGEPNDHCDGEDFVHLQHDGTWNDQAVDGSCSAWGLMAYICEWTGTGEPADDAGRPQIEILAGEPTTVARLAPGSDLPFGQPLRVVVSYEQPPLSPPGMANVRIGDRVIAVILQPMDGSDRDYVSDTFSLFEASGCFGLVGCMGDAEGVQP